MEDIIREAQSSLPTETSLVAPSVILCPMRSSGIDYEKYLTELLQKHNPDHVVSIERPCRARDNLYHNMRGLDITQYTAPLDWFFLEAAKRSIRTVGVGDGGNEIGMLNLLPYIEKHVPNGPVLASAVGCDYLISAGCVCLKFHQISFDLHLTHGSCRVSNWGGYAIAAALYALHRDRSGQDDQSILVDVHLEKKIVQFMTEKYGIVDGPLAKVVPFIDGLPFDPDHLQLISQLEAAAKSH
eukprot:TRINITY_DN2061_c0_g1_i2.p1 TRINITY_DN2061_c0_g1~~TRINITY_DN2061_c0_g1_i2.p1  ORF type:complete len:241 (+),score=27.85 TRINITY_DN2061_c0_g1_i2:535-1257(+)